MQRMIVFIRNNMGFHFDKSGNATRKSLPILKELPFVDLIAGDYTLVGTVSLVSANADMNYMISKYQPEIQADEIRKFEEITALLLSVTTRLLKASDMFFSYLIKGMGLDAATGTLSEKYIGGNE